MVVLHFSASLPLVPEVSGFSLFSRQELLRDSHSCTMPSPSCARGGFPQPNEPLPRGLQILAFSLECYYRSYFPRYYSSCLALAFKECCLSLVLVVLLSRSFS